MNELVLPDLGEGLQEAEIVSWLVREGDVVEADQPIVAVETAKAVVEVPAPVTGKVARIHHKEGDIVEVGSVLVSFEGAAKVHPSPAAKPAEPAPPAPKPVVRRPDRGTVAGSLDVGDDVVNEDEESVRSRAPGGVKAIPAVRALARKLNVDLKVVTPTGPKDSITKADVERVYKILQEVEPMEELRGVRRAMSQIMATAHSEIVDATIIDDADIHAWKEGNDVTIRLIRAIVAGNEAEPSLNGWFFPKELGRRLLKKVHLGIAMDTADGLFVPVIEDVGNKSPELLRSELNELKQAVRARSIPPEKLRGNTITLSNFGMFAGKYGTPIVIPPTMAILATGRIFEAVKMVDGKAEARRMIPLSVNFDHRAITGGECARWLKAVIEDLEASE